MSNTAAKIAERALPQVYVVVFRAGGWPAVQGFAKAFGGRLLRIPKTKPGDHHPIVAAAGRAAADALVEAYGAEASLEIPTAGHSLKLMVVKDNLHLSTNALAGLLGCGWRWAWNLRQEAERGDGKRRKPGRPRAPADKRQIDIEDLLT